MRVAIPFLKFFAFAYWPIVLTQIWYAVNLLLGLVLLVSNGIGLANLAVGVFESGLFYCVTLGLGYLSFVFYRKFESLTLRFITIYFSWQVFIIIIFFVVSVAMTGVSMAVSDGGLHGFELKRQALEVASDKLRGYSWPHIFTLFWSGVVVGVLKFSKHGIFASKEGAT